MKTDRSKYRIRELLSYADISIDGNNPWDIRVNDDRFYARALADGALGAGESYMEKWWDCEELDEFITRILNANLQEKIRTNLKLISTVLFVRIFNKQSRTASFINGQKHYDLGNDLFTQMLDKRLVYSCGYWKNAASLDEAQENKLDLTCRKLSLKPGMRVLDIGCGWGSFAKYAAENYSVNVTGITVSKEQAEYGRKICSGLPVDIRLMDYRDLNEKFDCIVSIGMFEHVGYKNYRTYMEVADNCLKDNGMFLLHTIGSNDSGKFNDPWFTKYIFPGSMLPSIAQIGRAVEGLFVMEDLHNFGTDYDRTLMAWHKNFINNWDVIKDRYDETFFRMWKYYLLSCAGSFRARKNQLWQIVLSKKGIPGGYTSIR
ncbi:MAG: cyclopropane fatty acyl phospholipid synthase [Bacteroidetes bacterium]|nr:cyclopropane fatty acyl phospholipid synthase [Bacteroidota bacterium]